MHISSSICVLHRLLFDVRSLLPSCVSLLNKSTRATPGKMKVLNVAEKNDAAKSIAHVMSRGTSQRREGYSKFNKIYQFDYMLHGQQVTMNMTSVSGHLQDLEFAGQYRSWKSCPALALFDAPVIKFVPAKFEPIKKTLEREARGARKLIIWTDCDREGENIGFEIIDVVTKVNPNIQVLRAKFSEITNTSISRAVANLIPPDSLKNDAVEVRRELDLRIGAAFTRFLTQRYQVAFPQLAQMLISYGSCQFPTLGFVVERYKQIQQFIAEPFWKLKVTLQEEGKKVDFKWRRVHLFDYDAVRALYELCIEHPTALVSDVKKKSKSKWRPVALDTVEFEKNMCRKLKVSAKRAMQIAEKLYTSGYISYPRTETNQFPANFNLRELVQNQTVDPNWGGFAGRLLEQGITPRNGNKSDQAHPPIHPTKHAGNLQGEEMKVYEFIARHFLACCSQDAKGFETTVEIEIASEKFSANGLVILERNYLDVYHYEKWSDKDIPDFEKGDLYQPDNIEMQAGETSPPNLLTEADLIALMEKHGIGTDATHAEHIEKIQERSYAGVQDSKFLPGKLGMGLVEGYDALGFEFSKPYLRAGLESDLKLICEGKRQRGDVLRDQIKTYREKFEISLQRVADIDNQMKKYLETPMNDPGPLRTADATPQIVVRKCPNCGSDMRLKQKTAPTTEQTQATQTPGTQARRTYYIGCMGYPQCRSAMWLPREVVDVSVLDTDCHRCGPGTKMFAITFKPGSVPPFIDSAYTGCIMCDRELQEAFDLTIKISNNNNTQRGNQAPPANDRGRSRGVPPRGRGGNVSASRTPTHSNAAPSIRSDESAEENHSVCLCGQPSILLTVRKEGPNQGRQFFKCKEGGCNFFSWANQPADTPRDAGGGLHGQGGRVGPQTSQRGLHTMRQNLNDNNSIQCACSQPSRRLTVQKEGANKGRDFFTCPKPRDQSCGFFQWAEDDVSTYPERPASTRGRSGARAGGAGRGADGATRGGGAKRKCGHCRQEGHTKKTCPEFHSHSVT